MRLAVFDDNNLLIGVYTGDDLNIEAVKNSNPKHLVLSDSDTIDQTRPAYLKDGKLSQPELTQEEQHTQLMRSVRERCQMELQGSDKWLLPDAPSYISEKLDAWKTYRQDLRDLPATIKATDVDIDKVVFPEPPSFT